MSTSELRYLCNYNHSDKNIRLFKWKYLNLLLASPGSYFYIANLVAFEMTRISQTNHSVLSVLVKDSATNVCAFFTKSEC